MWRRLTLIVGGSAVALVSACGSSDTTPSTVTVTAPPSQAAPSSAGPPASSPAASSSEPGASPMTCGPDETSALKAALGQLPPEPQTGMGWNSTPIESNYNPCSDLSTILVMIESGTGSSPVQALMFHRGEYLGTGTSKAYGFTSLNKTASTGDTVVLDYKTPGECNACPPAAVNSVRYQWQGDHVEMLDPPPPS